MFGHRFGMNFRAGEPGPPPGTGLARLSSFAADGVGSELYTGVGDAALSPFAAAGTGTVVGGSWSPTDLATLTAWWDASNLASLFQDDAGTFPVVSTSDPVGFVTDLAGFGWDLIQATGSKKPTYDATGGSGGLPGIVFDGTDDFLKTASMTLTDFTLLLVYTRVGAGGYLFVWSTSGTPNAYYYHPGGFSYALDRGTLVGGNNAGIFPATSDSGLVTLIAASGSPYIECRLDQASVLTNTNDPGSTPFTQPFSFPADDTGGYPGDVILCEAILCESALSGADLTSAENYLKNKWSTP